MTQCILLNIDDADDWKCYVDDGRIVIPKRHAPTVVQASRALAEEEAVRLARHTGGSIAVFELAGLVSMLHGHPHVTLGGEPIKSVAVPTWSTDPEIP